MTNLVVTFAIVRTRLEALDTIINLCCDTVSQSISSCLGFDTLSQSIPYSLGCHIISQSIVLYFFKESEITNFRLVHNRPPFIHQPDIMYVVLWVSHQQFFESREPFSPAFNLQKQENTFNAIVDLQSSAIKLSFLADSEHGLWTCSRENPHKMLPIESRSNFYRK